MSNSVQIFSGLNPEKRSSSKVLRPPGGGSSDIFGLNEPEPAVKDSPPPTPEQEATSPVAEAVVAEAAPAKPTVNGNSEAVKVEAPAAAETPVPASPVKVDTEVVNGVSDDLKAASIKADVEPVVAAAAEPAAAAPVERKLTPQKSEQGEAKQSSPLPSNEARAAANAQLTADLNAAAAASAESSAVAAHAKVAQRQSSIDVGTRSNDRPMVDPSSGRVMGAPQARTGRVPPGGFSSGGFW